MHYPLPGPSVVAAVAVSIGCHLVARARAIGNVLQVGFLENVGSFFVPRNLLESSEGPPTCVLVLSKFKPRHRTMQEVVLKNDVVVLLCPLLSFSFVWLSSVLQAAVLHDFYPL